MRLTPAEEKSGRLVVSDAMSALEGEFAPDEIKTLGSRSTGLATPLSDFDFSIMPKEGADGAVTGNRYSGKDFRRTVDDIMSRTEERLRTAPEFKSVRRVYARAHLVRAIHRRTGCQLEFQTLNLFQASQEQTKAWLREIPSLRPLFVTMRLCLEIFDLNEIFKGGIGSYTLIVMVVTALKHANDAHDPNDLGGQLLHVLNFWGSANLYKYTYSPDPPIVYEKVEKSTPRCEGETEVVSQILDSQQKGMDELRQRNCQRPYLLCLQDPTNHLNDLGSNSHAIKNIQAIFKVVHQRISDFVRTGERSRTKSESHLLHTDREGDQSVLYEMIRADFRYFEVIRSFLERFANPERRGNTDRRDKTINFEQQVRAIEHRKRHGLKTLITQPHAFLGDWNVALGLRKYNRRPVSGDGANANALLEANFHIRKVPQSSTPK